MHAQRSDSFLLIGNIELIAHQTIDGRALARKAYMLVVDSYKTPLCLEYPVHSIAAGAIWLANRLLKDENSGFVGLDESKPWDLVFRTRMEDMEGNFVECVIM